LISRAPPVHIVSMKLASALTLLAGIYFQRLGRQAFPNNAEETKS
jgi:hypothetical protein